MNQFRSIPASLTPTRRALPQQTVARLTRRTVPRLADFSLVHLVSGRTLKCVASAHVSRDGARLVRALLRTYRLQLQDPHSSVAQVVRTGRPMLRSVIRPEAAPADDDSNARRIADLHRQLGTRSALIVPVLRDGGVAGALSLCYSQSGRTYVRRDLSGALRVASKIAAALDTALTHATRGLQPAARHARPDASVRRRVAARN